jgi:hypothetical protein
MSTGARSILCPWRPARARGLRWLSAERCPPPKAIRPRCVTRLPSSPIQPFGCWGYAGSRGWCQTTHAGRSRHPALGVQQGTRLLPDERLWEGQGAGIRGHSAIVADFYLRMPTARMRGARQQGKGPAACPPSRPPFRHRRRWLRERLVLRRLPPRTLRSRAAMGRVRARGREAKPRSTARGNRCSRYLAAALHSRARRRLGTLSSLNAPAPQGGWGKAGAMKDACTQAHAFACKRGSAWVIDAASARQGKRPRHAAGLHMPWHANAPRQLSHRPGTTGVGGWPPQ